MLLICFCSEWCNTCVSFKEKFDLIDWDNVRKHWIDIDSDSILLDGVNISKIPSVLLVSDDRETSFFSELSPKIDRLKFLVDHINKGTFPKGHTDIGAEIIAKRVWDECEK